MGIVYLAEQAGLRRKVALKVLDPQLAANPEFVARFHAEAAALARIDSPHIVTIYDHAADKGFLYLAMQYVAGPDLAEHIATRGPLASDSALELFRQIMAGLHDAHSAEVIHRDVKPSNILLRTGRETPHAYLCDFGIAQAGGPSEAGVTRPGIVVGSLAYMAPERHHGVPATVQSDIYSAACVLWQMLTGNTPYSGTEYQQITAHMHEPPPQLPQGIEQRDLLNRLLDWCMAKDPARRPASADEVVKAIAAADIPTIAPADPASAGLPPNIPPTVSVSPARQPAERKPGFWAKIAAAAAAGVAVVALTAWYVVASWPTDPGGSATGTPDLTGSAAPGAVFTCWDGSKTAGPEGCGHMSGEPGKATPLLSPSYALAYIFPSLAEQFGAGYCEWTGLRYGTETWECELEPKTLIRYRYWLSGEEAQAHYADKFGGAAVARYDVMLGGQEVGSAWKNAKPNSNGRYELTLTWLNYSYSSTVEAADAGKLDELLAQLRFRDPGQLEGYYDPPGAGELQPVLIPK
jgi:hypothetical protein